MRLVQILKPILILYENSPIRFDMSEQDSRIWLDQTVWKNSDDISLKSLENAKAALLKIDESMDIPPFQQLSSTPPKPSLAFYSDSISLPNCVW
jgi:hypothetical protein